MIIDNIENCNKIIKLRRSKTNSKIKELKILIYFEASGRL